VGGRFQVSDWLQCNSTVVSINVMVIFQFCILTLCDSHVYKTEGFNVVLVVLHSTMDSINNTSEIQVQLISMPKLCKHTLCKNTACIPTNSIVSVDKSFFSVSASFTVFRQATEICSICVLYVFYMCSTVHGDRFLYL